MQTAFNISQEIQRLTEEQTAATSELNRLNKKKYLIILDDEALYQEFGLYTPVYNLMNSEAYKDRMEIVREQQKAMIKKNTAVFFPTNFMMNNSLAQGKKLVWRHVTT